jgi:hypothetical protein
MWSVVTAAAEDAGRDPHALSLVVHANVKDTGRPAGSDRPTYHGSIDQIAHDIRGAFDLGARHVILYLQGSTASVQQTFDVADAIKSAADLDTAA